MHKRHLTLLAASLLKAKPSMEYVAYYNLVSDVGHVCAKLNPLFRWDHWHKATGITS